MTIREERATYKQALMDAERECTALETRLAVVERERDEYKQAAGAEAQLADEFNALRKKVERERDTLRAALAGRHVYECNCDQPGIPGYCISGHYAALAAVSPEGEA